MLIAIVPTACGIETMPHYLEQKKIYDIAIVPTACGIETKCSGLIRLLICLDCNSTYRLRY